MYRPRDLHEFLDQLGVGPKKSLSQNFLVDGNIIRKIADAADVQDGDQVLEIGPGPGALTQELLRRGAHVTAVEKDRVFAEHLSRLEGTLDVHCQDILEFDLKSYFPSKKVKVIANLPYHITTPIITKLVELRHHVDTLVIMVQHEVAKRMTAAPGSKDYGSLTVFLDYHCDSEYVFKVNRTCFYPQPNVDSAVVKLQLKEPPKISDSKKCLGLIRFAFEQRRKMLRKTWGSEYESEDVMRVLEDLQLNPQARPEELSLDDFIAVFELLELAADKRR